MEWREEDGIRWLEAELPGARASFSTRLGGASGGPFESLNLGLLTDDEPAAVRANRLRLAATLGRDPEGVLFGHQVHGSEIARRQAAPAPNPFTADVAPADGDGQATSNAELTPLVQVADCLPVALAGEGGVAMLHCGWRGLAGGIVERGVREVGASAAAIGPGIGPCCYEVGDQVLARFTDLGDGIAAGRMLDLAEVARRLLARVGVEAIESSRLCTSCERELFFSHRRDAGRTGRQAGLVWLEDDDG
jgi:YfiH family protein